ncbi:MAG TPA: hypothetical protein VGN57_17665 [Pirellulaceae bacterium]|jgi:hypothetical protein|nr:hypothetical protein [Pirellulaceae bacterium]
MEETERVRSVAESFDRAFGHAKLTSMSDRSKTPGDRSRIQLCLEIASSIGKGLAVIAAVVAVYLLLMAAAFRAFVWLITGEFLDALGPP